MKKMQVTRTTLEASTRALILARTVHPGHTIPCAHGQDRPAQAAAVHFIRIGAEMSNDSNQSHVGQQRGDSLGRGIVLRSDGTACARTDRWCV